MDTLLNLGNVLSNYSFIEVRVSLCPTSPSLTGGLSSRIDYINPSAITANRRRTRARLMELGVRAFGSTTMRVS